MRGKRKNSTGLDSGGVGNEKEADDFRYDVNYDMRLARRWKRRRVADQNFKSGSGGKRSSSEGEGEEKCNALPAMISEITCGDIDHEMDVDEADSDYREYLDSLFSESSVDNNTDNCGNVGADKFVKVVAVDVDSRCNDASGADPKFERNSVGVDTNKNVSYSDADYEKYFDSLPLGGSDVGKCRAVNTADSRGDRVVEDAPHDDSSVDADEGIHEGNDLGVGENEEDVEDADYMKYFASESFDDIPVDSDNFVDDDGDVNAVSGSVENTSSEHELVNNESGNDHTESNNVINASGDLDPQIKEIHKTDNIQSNDDKLDVAVHSDMDLQNKKDLECSTTSSDNDKLHVDDDKFVDGSAYTAINAVHESVENGCSGEDLVDNERADDHNNNNVNSLGHMDPQNKKTPESNNVEANVDKLDLGNRKSIDGSALGPLGDSDVCCDWFPDNIVTDLNGGNQSTENNAPGNCSKENAAVAGGLVESRSANSETDHSDVLDDPQYTIFLKNVRVDGLSYVLEVPGNDGFFEIIKYEMDDGSPDRCRAKEHPKRTRRPRPEVAGWTKHDGKHKMKCNQVDHCYQIFLNSLKQEGNHWVFTHERGAKVVYDEDEGPSDSEVIVMDSDPFAGKDYTPFVTKTIFEIPLDDGVEGHQDSRRHDLWFREKVTEILRKPYDHKEYMNLLREVYLKKPVTRDVDLRNGRSRRCVVQEIGKSYLDNHKDLDKKIRSAGSSKSKVLNLLRGFFYWLQNVAHDGVFKPWMDSSCLEIMPNVD